MIADGGPRIVLVLGKGGVGRSTTAAALGLALAERGARTLVLEWSLSDVIGPWFGVPAAGAEPREIAPRLAVANFSLDDALHAYFVDHLHLDLVYRRVIRARSVRRVIDVAPGIAEMFFLGQLWWLTSLAEREAGLRFDRIVVDVPATGHGASILDLPALLSGIGAAGLLAMETHRLLDLLADPARLGAVVVTLPEPLVVDETFELIPRVTARLGRPPLGLIVNRSVADLVPGELHALTARLSRRARDAAELLARELRDRAAVEHAVRDRARGAVSFAELPGTAPIDVVRAAARALEAA